MTRLDPDLAAPLSPGAARARLHRLWHARPSAAAPLLELAERLGGDAAALDVVAAWTDVATAEQLLLILERQPARGMVAASRMAWSLLEPWAQHALMAAATFVTPFCSVSFSAVYDPACSPEAPGSAAALAELVRRRLVVPVHSLHGAMRIRPRVRQALADRLDPTADPRLVRRHARALLTLAELSTRDGSLASLAPTLELREIAHRALLVGDGDLACRATLALADRHQELDAEELGSLATRVLGIADLGPWRDALRPLVPARARAS